MSAPTDRLTVFIPGLLASPMNASGYGLWKHRRWAKTWREKAAAFMLYTWGRHAGVDPATPKRITFYARVGAEWDDDNLRAGLKPVRDALKDMHIVNDDRPSAGHEWLYRQVIVRPRNERGVTIIVEPLP